MKKVCGRAAKRALSFGEKAARTKAGMKPKKPRTEMTGVKGPSLAKAVQRKPPDLAAIRREIEERVCNRAVGMVEDTMEEAAKGHYLGMKYLFEMIGLYPAPSGDDVPVQDSLAAILLRTLGLPDAPMPEPGVTKDSARHMAATGDDLE